MTDASLEALIAEKRRRGGAMYERGATTITALASDPRFSFCLYVPPTLSPATQLVVTMHGTGRSFIDYRNAFSEFGRWNDCVILAPLFPAGVRGDGSRDGFKYMLEGDIRYDHVLLQMVAEVEGRYGVAFDRFALFGYSGGGHFTHRFFMLHPDRLWAASVGAPGSVTLLDPERDWWVGVRDFETKFGQPLLPEEMAKVPVQMVVGASDIETWEITHVPGGRNYMEGANDAGRTRPERLQALARSFEAQGITVRFDLLPGLTHDGMKVLDAVKTFFFDALSARRSGAGK